MALLVRPQGSIYRGVYDEMERALRCSPTVALDK
jgi:hypothetical protein